MKSKDTQIELNPVTYDFILRPLSVTATDLPNGQYKLQLEKGPQHVKTLQETVFFSSSQMPKNYLFKSAQQIWVKLFNPKHADYSWVLYRMNEQTMECLGSIKFNLNDFYLAYTQEIRQSGLQYNKILHDRITGHAIQQSWKKMKAHLKNSSFTREGVNEYGNFKLKYTLEIKGQLDYFCERQPIKSKLTSKGSGDSEVSNNLSKNEPNIVAKKVTLTEVKYEELINCNNLIKGEPDDTTHIQVLAWDEPAEQSLPPPALSPKFAPYVQNTSDRQPSTPYLHANNSGGLRRMILSDIIEKSNEGSISFITSVDRTEIKPQEISEQGASRGKLLFQKKTTLNIEPEQLQSHVIRRTNTLQLLKTPEQPGEHEEQSHEGNDPQVNQFQKSPERVIINSIVSPQQDADTYGSQERPAEIKKEHNTLSVKSIAFLILILVVFFNCAGLLIYPYIAKNVSKGPSKSSPKLAKESMKPLLKGKLKQ